MVGFDRGLEFGTQFEASLGGRGQILAPKTPLLDHFGGSWGPFCAIFGPCELLRCAVQVTGGPKVFTLDTQLAAGANPPSLFAVFCALLWSHPLVCTPPPLVTPPPRCESIWAPGEGREGELTHSLTPMTP